jgi:hypothetical protein
MVDSPLVSRATGAPAEARDLKTFCANDLALRVCVPRRVPKTSAQKREKKPDKTH